MRKQEENHTKNNSRQRVQKEYQRNIFHHNLMCCFRFGGGIFHRFFFPLDLHQIGGSSICGINNSVIV